MDDTVQSVMLPLSKIEQNKGQIDGIPKNPRLIKNDKFKKLVQSIREDQEMLRYRELLVYPLNGKYVIIGGNMRYAAMMACEQLGRKARLMEFDPHYCDVIIARWEKFTNKKAIKLNE